MHVDLHAKVIACKLLETPVDIVVGLLMTEPNLNPIITYEFSLFSLL
jgi:hypothetical protein